MYIRKTFTGIKKLWAVMVRDLLYFGASPRSQKVIDQ